MKKKGIATLALAGALAVSMVPAFAAQGHQTIVGYTAGGNTSTDGRVMVTVPKDVTFTNTSKSATGFDVKALVWDSANGNWTTPGTIKLGKTIKVSVASANGYKLKNTSYTGVEGAYQYEVGTYQGQTALKSGTEAVEIGTLQDTESAYTLAGTVTMTTTPNVGQTETAVHFSDTLSYTFAGLTD